MTEMKEKVCTAARSCVAVCHHKAPHDCGGRGYKDCCGRDRVGNWLSAYCRDTGNAKGAVRTCIHCGHTGPDVSKQWEYVGGRGDVFGGPYCQNHTECWQRWDIRNGLT